MGKKLVAVIGAGVAFYLVKKNITENPNGTLARIYRAIIENPTVVEYTEKTKEKVGEKVREQGEIVTDRVAEAVKDRLFRPDPAPAAADNTPEYVDVEVEEIIVTPPPQK